MEVFYEFSRAIPWSGPHPLRMQAGEVEFGLRLRSFERVRRSDPRHRNRLPQPHRIAAASELIVSDGRYYEVPEIEISEPLRVLDRGDRPLRIPSFPA